MPRIRKNGHLDRRCRDTPGYVQSPGRTVRTWTPERDARYRASQQPIPAHVVHLRAGITEFRRMLQAKAPRDE